MRRTLLLSLLAVTALTGACGDDDASTSVGDEPIADDDLPLGAGPYPIADLMFSIRPEGPAGPAQTYRLACLGDTATFTGDPGPLDAASACLALTEQTVRTRLLLGPPADQICTEVFGGPQIARIAGTLDEQPVDATADRANGCGISDYDVVLAALLPPAGR